MLSRVSSALQTAADVLAPPASRVEDFEYHWKLIQNYYHTHDESCKEHIEETSIPYHLYQMLQLLVEEENEQGETVGACAERLVSGSMRVLDGVCAMASAERPPGARATVLAWCTALLRRLKQPLIHHAPIYRPVQRILIHCSDSPASPTEKEEVELLLTLCGLVRKQPGLANVFTTPFAEDKSSLMNISDDILDVLPIWKRAQTPTKNPLFQFDVPNNPIKKISIISHTKEGSVSDRVEKGNDDKSGSGDDATSCKSQKTVYDDNDKFLLIDLLLSYLNSADNHIVLRACEGIMIVSSLKDEDIANLVSGCSSVCESLVHKLAHKYRQIPADIDPANVDLINTSWGYVAQDFGEKFINKFHGYRELASFLSWLDYCDTLMKECHPNIASHLARTFRQNFLEATVEIGLNNLHHTVIVTAVISKCLKVIDSTDLISEISNWLVGDGEIPEWPLLHTLIDNCLSNNYELTLETLKFFETIIEKPTEHSIQRLVLCRLTSRGYYCVSDVTQVDTDDERDRLNAVSLSRERDSNKQIMKQLMHEGHVNDQISELLSHEGVDGGQQSANNIHKVINSFLLLLPKAILSDPVGVDYEQYIHDAHRHYQAWLDITSPFNWPTDFVWVDNTASSTHSYDSRPEDDIHLSETTLKDDDVFEPVMDKETTSEVKNKRHDKNDKIIVPNTGVDLCNVLNGKINFEKPKMHEKLKLERQILTTEMICCTHDDVKANKIGKCGKPASQCPFSQHLVLRSRDMTSSKSREDTFDEGPFLRMLFHLLSHVPEQSYQINLQLTSIISKLAMLPHPNLHEYLLNPMLPVAKSTRTLFKVLKEVSAKLTMEIPRVRNYGSIIETTRLMLMGEDHSYDENGEHNQLFEGLIVIEEFCKELAAIAFVKYQHQVHSER